MLELREVFEMVTKQTEPDLDSWKQQEERQRRRARKQRLGAIAVAAAVILAVGVLAIATRSGSGPKPAGQPSGVPIDTTPPMGVQLVTPDGTAVRQFPGNHNGDAGLQLSPDGSTLSYMSQGWLNTVSVDGSNHRILSPNGNTNSGDAEGHTAWSPDGTQIAYSFSGDIHVINADGSGDHAITHAPNGIGYFYPVWSSEGTIAFWGGTPTGEDGGPADSEIYTVPATGGDVTRLTHNDVSNIEPAWSPDGSRIAYWNGGDLFVMRAGGGNQHLVVSEGGSWAPAWSPDGTQIAYLVFVGDMPDGSGCCSMQLRTVDLSSGAVTKLPVHSNTDYSGPQWVSDGEILINRYN
jgi:WD40-like Beta Propeller Repeat